MRSATLDILLELAPWMLLGMAVAGAIHGLLPSGFLQRHLAGKGAIWRAVLFGVPMPLCSCSVIPTGLGLKKDGASNGATVAFLTSTPQTGVDSVLVTASFLGWPFAITKVIAAATTGLIAGGLTDRGADNQVVAPPVGKRPGFRSAVDHAIDVLRSIYGWLIFGILVSAAITTWLPGTLAGIGELNPLVGPLLALLISLPLYVCATASVPIAAALVAGGLPMSAALVFLMAGPATNVATMGAVYRTLGKRTLVIYLSTLIVGSLGFGLAFDALFPGATPAVGDMHNHAAPWRWGAVIVLVAMMAWFAIDDLLQRFRPAVPASMELQVDGMTCGGCARKLQRKLEDLDGVQNAAVSHDPGSVALETTLNLAQISAAITEAGYTIRDSHPSTS